MSRSRRDRNHRREEARYSDGVRSKSVKTSYERAEKKVKNLFRSNRPEELIERDLNDLNV